MVEQTTRIIKKQELKDNPDTLYLFGDNYQRYGKGGQAKEMRGEPNAIGIVTKFRPNMDYNAFMQNKFFDVNCKAISLDINKVIEAWQTGKYNKIVIPPLGTGLADLPNKAPLTYQFLNSQIQRIIDICN